MYRGITWCYIALIAGSRFSAAEETYPFWTEALSKNFKYPPMPFDGVLFGSRMMTAKQAYTA